MKDGGNSLQTVPPAVLSKDGLQGEVENPVLVIAPEEHQTLLDYWHVILRRRWAVLTCFAIIFSTVMIATLKEKPVYEGRTLVEINPEEPNVLNFKEILQVDDTDADSYRETQYRIIQSRTLAERVVRDLALYKVPEFAQRELLFGLIKRTPRDFNPASDLPPGPENESYRNAVAHLIGSIDVEPVRRSNLVEIGCSSNDPKLAARITNQLASDYIDQNLKVKWDETEKATDWLSTRLVSLKAKLEKSEDDLQSYAQQNSIVFVEEKENLVTARLGELQTEYTKAQADRFQKESLYSLVKANRIQDLPGFLDNRLIQDLEAKLADLDRQYSEMTSVVKPSYPKAVQLKNQMDSTRAALDQQKRALTENIVQDYQAAVERENYLSKAIDEQKQAVNAIAEKSIGYNILKREVDTNRQLYEGLLQRLKEAQVSAGLKASNIRIVDASDVPTRPVKPRIIVNLALGLILGTGLGLGLAFFREYLDNTLKGIDDIENLIRTPALGILPMHPLNGGRHEGSGELSLAEGSPSSSLVLPTAEISEAYRSLRTSILLSASPVPKVLLVTSALPSEGKTTVTINLGITLASLDTRVVVIDCDMRRPRCHEQTGVKNSPGLVQYMTGHVSLQDAILPVPGVTNLSVIPCGPIPPNPAEILASPLTAELVNTLRSQFDYILIDSPPLLSVSDSRILATMVDAVVLVARAHQTPIDAVRRTRQLLERNGVRILGVALNAVDLVGPGYSAYYSRYGYKYGYGGHYGYGYGYAPKHDAHSDRQGEAGKEGPTLPGPFKE